MQAKLPFVLTPTSLFYYSSSSSGVVFLYFYHKAGNIAAVTLNIRPIQAVATLWPNARKEAAMFVARSLSLVQAVLMH